MTFLSSSGQKETTYTTRQGDVVDAICFDHYGVENSKHVNAVYRRNPHLCRLKAVLPGGVRVVFPIPVVREKESTLASIWITPSNQQTISSRQIAVSAAKKKTVAPTQAEIEKFIVSFQQLKAAGQIDVPDSPLFIPSYYSSGEDGISDPFVPLAEPVLTLL